MTPELPGPPSLNLTPTPSFFPSWVIEKEEEMSTKTLSVGLASSKGFQGGM